MHCETPPHKTKYRFYQAFLKIIVPDTFSDSILSIMPLLTVVFSYYWNPTSLQRTQTTTAMKISTHHDDLEALEFVPFHYFSGLTSALLLWIKEKWSQSTLAIRMQGISHAGQLPD